MVGWMERRLQARSVGRREDSSQQDHGTSQSFAIPAFGLAGNRVGVLPCVTKASLAKAVTVQLLAQASTLEGHSSRTAFGKLLTTEEI